MDLNEADGRIQTVEVFKTDVEDEKEAKKLVEMLIQHYPGSRVNFDLQDCDRILRVEGKGLCNEAIKMLLEKAGYYCSMLE